MFYILFITLKRRLLTVTLSTAPYITTTTTKKSKKSNGSFNCHTNVVFSLKDPSSLGMNTLRDRHTASFYGKHKIRIIIKFVAKYRLPSNCGPKPGRMILQNNLITFEYLRKAFILTQQTIIIMSIILNNLLTS